MGDGPERGNTRIERLFREKAMMVASAVFVPVTAVEPGCVSTVAVRGSTLMFEIGAWSTVRLGHWLCTGISQGCQLRGSRSFAGNYPRWRALDRNRNIFDTLEMTESLHIYTLRRA